MKKTTDEPRINDAVSAFFDNEPDTFGENCLTFAPDSALLKPEPSAQFNENGDRLIKILKRVFLFLPGALYLFFGTLSIFSFEFLWNPLTVLAVLLIGSFLTIFGLGSLKNPKHLAIPFSIVVVGMTTFWFFSTLGGLKYVFEYGIYFFPLALIAPVLAKSLVDDKKNFGQS